MKILIIGTLPPPIGGITIHLNRFLYLYSSNEFDLGILDIKKKIIFKKNKEIKKIFNIVQLFLSSKIIHIHISNDIIKFLLALGSKFFFKKIVYTHHNSLIKNKLLFKLMYKLCDKVILVNDKEIDKKLIIKNKTEIIPAFLPPYKFDKLPKQLEQEIKKYKNIISTNCYMYNLINGRHIYGFDLIIEAFYHLSLNNQIENTILVLVDPSNTTNKFVNQLLNSKNFKTNKVLLINEEIDFISLLKKSTLTIRATRTDGDSLSVREALYFNIPIIASDVTIRPKGTILFHNEDIEDLSNKIKDTLKIGYIDKYSHIDYGQRIIKVYTQLIKENSL